MDQSAKDATRAAGGAARLDRDAIEGLKARVDLLELAGRYTGLKRRGRDWWGCCPIHDERTPSFRVDPSRQSFRCFGCGTHGDAVDLVAAVERVDTGTALRRLRDQVGGAPPDPQIITARATREAVVEAREKVESAQRQALSLAIWRASETIPPGLPFDYLAERRGIPSWDSDRLRWHPECPWGTGTAGCIIACVTDHRSGYATAIWRIRPVLEGKVERRGLGPTKGNAARLFEPEGDEVAVSEGVEDALAFHALTGLPTWSALSSSNMRALILPARFRHVAVVADNDPPDPRTGVSPGVDAAQELARRLLAEGRAVEVFKPKNLKDASDVLQQARRSAA